MSVPNKSRTDDSVPSDREISKPFPWGDGELQLRMREAVIAYWAGRDAAKAKQLAKGIEDAGTRSEVTGGKHFHFFHDLFVQLAHLAGYGANEILTGSQSTAFVSRRRCYGRYGCRGTQLYQIGFSPNLPTLRIRRFMTDSISWQTKHSVVRTGRLLSSRVHQ